MTEKDEAKGIFKKLRTGKRRWQMEGGGGGMTPDAALRGKNEKIGFNGLWKAKGGESGSESDHKERDGPQPRTGTINLFQKRVNRIFSNRSHQPKS